MIKALIVVQDRPLTRRIALALRRSFGQLKVLIASSCGEGLYLLSRDQPDLLVVDTRIPTSQSGQLNRLLQKHGTRVKVIFTGHELTMVQGRTCPAGEEAVRLLERHFDSRDLVELVGEFLDIPFQLPVVDDLLDCDVVEHVEPHACQVHELASYLTGIIAQIHSGAEELKAALKRQTLTEEEIEGWNREIVEEINSLWQRAKELCL